MSFRNSRVSLSLGGGRRDGQEGKEVGKEGWGEAEENWGRGREL